MWRVSTVLELSGLSTPMKAYAEETRVRGTAVHKANESLAEGYTPEVDPLHQGYVDGLVAWYRKFAPTVVATERRIVNRMKRLNGQIDLAALIEGFSRQIDPFIVDVKTGSKAPWHGIQTAGYKDLALEDNELWALFGPPYSQWTFEEKDARLKRAILYLPGDGKFVWSEQKDPSDHWRFSSALGLMQWRHDHGLLHYVDTENPTNDGKPVQVMPSSTSEIL